MRTVQAKHISQCLRTQWPEKNKTVPCYRSHRSLMRKSFTSLHRWTILVAKHNQAQVNTYSIPELHIYKYHTLFCACVQVASSCMFHPTTQLYPTAGKQVAHTIPLMQQFSNCCPNISCVDAISSSCFVCDKLISHATESSSTKFTKAMPMFFPFTSGLLWE